MLSIAAAGALYFAIVFSTGFLLGVVRTLVITPRIGARRAELLESPVMLVVSILAAGWVISYLAVPRALPARLAMGLIGLALMLAAEFGLVLRLRKLSLRAYFASRDPVAAAVYYLLLLVFAVLPVFVTG